MQEVLDAASEEPIEAGQVDRFRRRTVNLAQLEGNFSLSEDLARQMREQGDFSGECLIVRRAAFEPGTRRARSRDSVLRGLEHMEAFGPSAYGSAEALELMHRLWMTTFLPGRVIGGPDPVFAACSDLEWLRWRRILEARMNLIGPGQNLFLGFCMAWTYVQIGEARLGQQEIRAIEPLSAGSRRRVGCLVVLTEADGTARQFRGTVRRREGDSVVAYVAALRTEIRLSPALMGRLAVVPSTGDEIEMTIGLNYRGLLPWRLSS